MLRRRLLAGMLVMGLCSASGDLALAQSAQDPLLRNFAHPPVSARPRVWWHWMNGNITEAGIKLDLQWMHRVGIGGVTVFEGSIDTPQVVRKRLAYMTPEWQRAFRYATTTARKLGLEMGIASSPGWSETGGPWVPPAQAMKKMVWTETRIQGGRPFSGTLPQPSHVSGTFQDYDTPPEHGANVPTFYADSAVIAYRLPSDDKTQPELEPHITASGGRVDPAALSDGKVNDVALLLPAAPPGREAWVQFEYPRPQTIQAVTLATLNDMRSIFDFDDPGAVYPRLEASDDGVHYRLITRLSLSSIPQRTVAFPAVTAEFFRVAFPTPAGSRAAAAPHAISELVLSSAARVNEFEKRAGYSTVLDYYTLSTPPATPGSVVAPSDVIDLTSSMQADGTLHWNAPPGKWAILRIGYSLTGHENGPAPIEATGLEVDKLDRGYVKNYVDGYLNTYSNTVGPSLMGTAGISSMLSDSAETGAQNWTDNILGEFERRRGYDAHAWLPALTGTIIQSPEASQRFLWDFRRTIAELFAQNHYGEIAAELHKRRLRYYNEALEYHRPSLGDDMEMRRYADAPMGAMWTFTPSESPTPTYIADVRGAASVAHIYGQNIVAAESMTSNGPKWGWSPGGLKRIADLELALGVNRFVIHESAHQPLIDKPPGLTLGTYGLWLNRNETWAEEAGPWIDYLARSSYLLQQGHYYADVAYFYGQEGPLTAVFGSRPQQDAPRGFGYDFVNADVILNQLTLQNGRLSAPTGTSYRLLYLGPRSRRMTLPVLRKIRDLLHAGAVVAGAKPIDSPSLADDQTAFHALAEQLWGTGNGPSVRAIGKGKLYTGRTANEVLADLGLQPDFEYTARDPDTELMFLHRQLPGADIYFVDNRKGHAEDLNATFRIAGKAPELWHADTGEAEPASFHISNGRTIVPLHLDANGAVFVVWRRSTSETSRSVPTLVETPLTTLDNAWSVAFQAHRGAPKSVSLDKLISWTDYPGAGVRYFSGTATYTRRFNAPAEWFKRPGRLWLDLGDVEDVAQVGVNGKPFETAWKAPFRVDVTDALRPGDNQFTIKVTNLWVNRLIGDQQPGATKFTFTTYKPYGADAPLLPSGLLGPVRLLSRHPGRGDVVE
ncbi:MAG TPA: glycosyl hydrolase [Steroidobacteraceae bacterium]|nr:glycosyl hydrolase [Steroidobacteraceae bacterium]